MCSLRPLRLCGKLSFLFREGADALAHFLVGQHEPDPAMAVPGPDDFSEHFNQLFLFHLKIQFEKKIGVEGIGGLKAQPALADVIGPDLEGILLDFEDVAGFGREDRKYLNRFLKLKTIVTALFRSDGHFDLPFRFLINAYRR